jgi:hypothetical protein
MAWRNILDAAWFAISLGILAVVAVVFLVVAIVALGIDLLMLHRKRRPHAQAFDR